MTIALDRIRYCVNRLDDPKTKKSERLACWRLIVHIASDAHDVELQQVESLKLVKADSAFEVPIA